MSGMRENANISLIFPEIALNHCCPNAKSSPSLPESFLQSDFHQAEADGVSNRAADGWVPNTSQEDPEPHSPMALVPAGRPAAPPASAPRGEPSRPRGCQESSSATCALLGKGDKCRNDVGTSVPTEMVSSHRSDLRLEPPPLPPAPPSSGRGAAARAGFAASTPRSLGREFFLPLQDVRGISPLAG